jgi:hypothetical protein
MRRIMILRTESGDRFHVLSLDIASEIMFRHYPRAFDNGKYGGSLEIIYAEWPRRRYISLTFNDKQDADQFEAEFLTFMREGSIPIETEDGREMRFWFETEIVEIKDAYH